jgi:hypothetical protein
MGHHKKPPVMFKQYVQELVRTVHKLTKDETIATADMLRAWMEAHAKELAAEGIEIPKAPGGSGKPDKDKKGKDGKDKGKDGKDVGKDAKDGKDGAKD